MAANRIEIDINANDNATGVINQVVNNFSRLSSSITSGNSGMASFMGNLGAGLAFRGLDLVQGKVDQIKNSLLEAAKIQTNFITAASSTSMNLKVGLDVGLDIQKKLGKSIAEAAASQPGETQDYSNLANMISGSIARGFEGDSEGFLKAAEEIVKNAGLLATTKGIDTGSAGNVLGKFINGSSGFQQMMGIDFFEKNQDLVLQIENVAKDRGLDVKKLQGWTQQQRIEVLKLASAKVITPELLASLNATADAKIESMKSQLFDPQIGVFGFLREIPTLDNRTILDTFSNFLDSFSALGSVVLGITEKLGISFDPLEMLGRAIDWLAATMDTMTVFLSKLNLDSVKTFDFSFSNIFEVLSKIDFGDFAKEFSKISSSFMNYVATALNNADWVMVGRYIGLGLLKIGDYFINILTNFDYGAFFKLVFQIFKAVISIAAGVVAQILVGIFTDIGRSLGNVFRFVADAIMSAVNTVKEAFQHLGDSIQNLLSKIPNPGNIVSGVSNGVSNVKANISNTTSNVVTRATNIVTGKKTETAPKKVEAAKAKPETAPKKVEAAKAIFAPKRLPTIGGSSPKTTVAKPKDQSVLPTFNPVININPSQGMDEASLGDMVVSRLNNMYTDYSNGVLQ